MKTIIRTFFFAFILFFCVNISFSQNNKSTSSINSNETLTLSIDGNGYQDQTYIMFDSAATNGFDNQFDMYKLFGMTAAPQLYSVIDTNIKLSINTLPSPVGNLRVQLGIRVGYDTTYTFTATGINTFAPAVYILLKDSLLNITTNLNTTPTYSFTGHTTDSATRFIIYIVNTTSVKEEAKDVIKVYSDDNIIYINTNTNSEIIKEVEVYNLTGQLVYKCASVNANFYKIPLKTEPKTYYLVRLVTDDKIINKKVFLK